MHGFTITPAASLIEELLKLKFQTASSFNDQHFFENMS